MNKRKKYILSRLLGVQTELEELYEIENGCTKSELVQLLRVIHMVDSTLDHLCDSDGKKQANTPIIDVPIHLPYKEARMRVIRHFQAAYCTHMMQLHGTTREASRAAKMDQGNFQRILRVALEETE